MVAIADRFLDSTNAFFQRVKTAPVLPVEKLIEIRMITDGVGLVVMRAYTSGVENDIKHFLMTAYLSTPTIYDCEVKLVARE